jgi:hypothetical protein
LIEADANVELHPALIDALRADRESLNAKFLMRKRGGARIDDLEFQAHLRTSVNALVGKVAGVLSEPTRTVTSALFDVSLDLFAAGLLGSAPKHEYVRAAWRDVLPQAAKLLARDPQRIAGCCSNAIDYVASQPGARPQEWIDRMRELSPACETVGNWLDAGRVVAWRAGLVQYRADALRIAREMPLELAMRCFGLIGGFEPEAWPKLLDRMDADPWLSPEAGISESEFTPSPRIVRMPGGFRGFGGPCLKPPVVITQSGRLFLTDGDASWQLFADVFGTLWLRLPQVPNKSDATADVQLNTRGEVRWGKETKHFPELATSSSFAFDGHTLAVTLPNSHHVFLVARAAGHMG